MKLADYHGAREAYQRALKLGIKNNVIHRDLGVIYIQEGNHSAALSELRISLELDPNDAETHFQVGKLLSKQDDNEKALHHLRQAVRLNRDHTGAHYALGRLLVQRGNDFEGQKMMATFQTLKKYEHKLKARKRDAQLRPRDAEAVYKVGLVHLEYGRRPKAIEAFSQSLNRNPGFEAAAAKLRDLERETNQ